MRRYHGRTRQASRECRHGGQYMKNVMSGKHPSRYRVVLDLVLCATEWIRRCKSWCVVYRPITQLFLRFKSNDYSIKRDSRDNISGVVAMTRPSTSLRTKG